jgi:4-amino-4-deoxy-L-arabinose transferase-like glycosyltransferase
MEDALKQKQEAGAVIGETIAHALAAIRRLIAVRKAELVCAALLGLMATNLFASISRKSITNDEIVHIPAGYYHLVAGKFQLNNEHPPLVKMWAALPLLFIQPSEKQGTDTQVPGNFSQETWKYLQYFWPDNRDQTETIYFWSRAMMVPITLGLGLLIFFYARDLFGARAGLLAVALYSLEPTVLAHGRIVHTDVPAALAYLLFFFSLRRYLLERSLRRAIILGVVTGLGLVTKFSMIVLLPVLACVTLAGIFLAPRWKENRRKITLHSVLVTCIILGVINAAYYFKSPPVEPEDVKWVQLQSPATFDNWITFFRVGSKIVPTYYLFGQYNIQLHNHFGHATSLLGKHNYLGWWYYFPVAFALKTSLPFLAVSIVGLVWALWRLLKEKDKRFLWLVIPFSSYAGMSMSSNINIGIRHFLPAYSFLFIAGGVLLERLLRVRQARHLAIAFVFAVLSWMAVEVLRAYPNYIPYMNQLASNHPHWWYLSDSNVEWGDDLNALADYLHARGETEVRGAMSGAWGTLGNYGITYHEIFPKPGKVIPETDYVAIGASFLNGSTIAVPASEDGKLVSEEQRINYLDVYRQLQPEAVLGGSIYVYRIK